MTGSRISVGCAFLFLFDEVALPPDASFAARSSCAVPVVNHLSFQYRRNTTRI